MAALASHIPAHDVTTTVAPFRAWRDSQLIIAGGPERTTIARAAHYQCFTPALQAVSYCFHSDSSDKPTIPGGNLRFLPILEIGLR